MIGEWFCRVYGSPSVSAEFNMFKEGRDCMGREDRHQHGEKDSRLEGQGKIIRENRRMRRFRVPQWLPCPYFSESSGLQGADTLLSAPLASALKALQVLINPAHSYRDKYHLSAFSRWANPDTSDGFLGQCPGGCQFPTCLRIASLRRKQKESLGSLLIYTRNQKLVWYWKSL